VGIVSFPILYEATETDFTHNGFGFLTDCQSCVVTEERNGIFEVDFKYPVSGIHFSEIAVRRIVKCKPNQISNPQLFRIYSISKPMRGLVTVFAEHISYDLSGIAVQPFAAENAQNALNGIEENAVVECPFSFSTDKATVAKFKVSVPTSARACLGGTEGSALSVYGGELLFDNYNVKLLNERGYDRGVQIRYGKNLTDLRQDENIASMYTAVYPYWTNSDTGELVTLTEKTVSVPGEFNFTRILTHDMSANFEEKPTEDQLREATISYIRNSSIDTPKISLVISFAQLEQTEEYKNLAALERVNLCDTVTVIFPDLGISAKAKAVRMLYDVLEDKVISVTLGNTISNISSTLVSHDKEIAEKPSKTDMRNAIEFATSSILGAKGGAVRMLDTNGDGEPDTLYIADNPDPALAVKVWRFNYEGWGASTNGYPGPFVLAATLNDGLVADFITAGTLNADLIRAGVLRSKDGTVEININNNTLDLDVGSSLALGNLLFFARSNGNISVRWTGG
jgi:phage minor structural protein